MARYGMTRTVKGDYDTVKTRLVDALKTQGFGIMSEIDVQKALKEKIGKDIERYEILGACNPHLAVHALDTERAIGLLLPCNVVLRDLSTEVEVSIIDPEVMLEVTSPETQRAFGDLPAQAKRLLANALDSLVAEKGEPLKT